MFKFSIYVLIATITWNCVASNDYCNPELCPDSDSHIACNNEGGYGKTCSSNAFLVPVTSDIRAFILNKVNNYRNKIASGSFEDFNPAQRMATIQWDPELAELAQLQVKQCMPSINKCRNTKNFKHVGQTVAHIVFRTNKYDIKNLLEEKIDKWFNEYKDATKDHISRLFQPEDKTITSFTQMVSDKSTHVGCGILRDKRNAWEQQYLVCLYARENFLNQPVYKSAINSPGEGCQTGTNEYFQYLCSENEQYDVNVIDDFEDNEIDQSLLARKKRNTNMFQGIVNAIQKNLSKTKKDVGLKVKSEEKKEHFKNQLTYDTRDKIESADADDVKTNPKDSVSVVVKVDT